jgi:acyl-CoA thioester hydrolase
MITYRGVVYPNQCDGMGHMNTQYYTAAFDQAFWHHIHTLGCTPEETEAVGWADARHTLEFRSELRAGDLFDIESELRRVGNRSITAFHRLSHTTSRRVSAELEAVVVCFDLVGRVSRAIPSTLAERLLSRSSAPPG